MSDFTLPLAKAAAVADLVCGILRPVTTQRFVAGSVRRGKERVRDIDLVLCPRYDEGLGGCFAGWSQPFLAAVRDCPRWTVETALKPDSRKTTLRSRVEPNLKIELWLATPWRVGWIHLLRTGPSEFTTELVSLAKMGLLTSAVYPGGSIYRFQDGALTCDGAPVRTPDEASVFHELGLPFAEPAERTVAWLQARQREQSARRRASA